MYINITSYQHNCVDYPPPIVEETCHYNDTGDFVTHNISWLVEGSVINYVFADNINYWLLSGGCYYPNGSVAVIPGMIVDVYLKI